jgi:UDP-glucose 4-epimerase
LPGSVDMEVLITGGAGYIGSTVASVLLDYGARPVILDSLATGRADFVAGRAFYAGDIADGDLLDQIFAEHPDIRVTVHCAAVIDVSESIEHPLRYFQENVAKTLQLLNHLRRNGCSRVVFSSSASVYGATDGVIVTEESPVAPVSPYARSKAMVEAILSDLGASAEVRSISLRYFNPIGADPWMRTGPTVGNPPSALGTLINAAEEDEPFVVTGIDWPTRDGSGLRDYVHVWDLARAHVAAVLRLDGGVGRAAAPGSEIINLGTGRGTTVFELVAAFESVTGRAIPVRGGAARAGDVAGAYPDVERAKNILGLRCEYDIEDGIRHALQWRSLDLDYRTTVLTRPSFEEALP